MIGARDLMFSFLSMTRFDSFRRHILVRHRGDRRRPVFEFDTGAAATARDSDARRAVWILNSV